ncbi:MAG: hypothetical protein HY270_22705 [Deltaproteobacteria bacterium]|nr:hypothetical protein [Deltaproteobacteria bacterium]
MRRIAIMALPFIFVVAPPARGSVPTTADRLLRESRLAFSEPQSAIPGDVTGDGRVGAADIVGILLDLHSPTEPGPYAVGVRQIAFAKKSETQPDQDRVLLTDIWYPTDASGSLSAKYRAILNAPLAEGASGLPLLLFSHGSCGVPEQSLFFTPLLASYGFIVAAPPHPGNTLNDLLAGHNCGSTTAITDSFLNREADMKFVLDSLLALNADTSSPFFGAIDPERIGMSGHSFGGQTTLRVSADDARIVAGLALAPALSPVEGAAGRVKIPLMIQDGTLDSVTPFATNSRAAYNYLRGVRYLLAIADTGHYAFSDNCFPSSDCGPDTLTQDQAHGYVLRFAVPYLLHWVAGDDRFDAFLDPGSIPGGVTLKADLRRNE